MAAERMDVSGTDEAADARMQIQDIIEDLTGNQHNLTEPSNETLDGKIEKLDKIFTECVTCDDGESDRGRSIDVSQARLDIQAFSLLASINHQRIRRVAASTWTFRASDFANRIVRLMNVDEGSQSESLTPATKGKLGDLLSEHFNQCTPLRPLVGGIVLTKAEVIPKERRQRATKEKEKPVVVQKPKRLTDITEEDQNTKVTKRVEFIKKILKRKARVEAAGKNSPQQRPVSFYHFVLDPKSFSNTIENIFYVSFLIKDGHVSLIDEGQSGLPELVVLNPGNADESRSQATAHKRQLILGFDHAMWQEMVTALDLREAAIPTEAQQNALMASSQQSQTAGPSTQAAAAASGRASSSSQPTGNSNKRRRHDEM